jgi:hypothetical protein
MCGWEESCGCWPWEGESCCCCPGEPRADVGGMRGMDLLPAIPRARGPGRKARAIEAVDEEELGGVSPDAEDGPCKLGSWDVSEGGDGLIGECENASGLEWR